jgi:hypothetical protein
MNGSVAVPRRAERDCNFGSDGGRLVSQNRWKPPMSGMAGSRSRAKRDERASACRALPLSTAAIQPKPDRPRRVPEERRRFLERCVLRQVGNIASTIIKSAIPDRRYGRRDDRLAPRDGACRDRGRTLTPLSPFCEAADVGSPILAAPRIVRIGPHADPAPAHIGVQRLGAHLQDFERFFAREPDFHS